MTNEIEQDEVLTSMDDAKAKNAAANERRAEAARERARTAPLSVEEIASWIEHGRRAGEAEGILRGIAEERARCVAICEAYAETQSVGVGVRTSAPMAARALAERIKAE